MATIRKRDGKFQAQVRRDGVFKSATFFKKSDAEIWARQVETAMCTGRVKPFVYSPRCLGEIIERYLDEVTPTKRGRVIEALVLRAMLREPFTQVPSSALGPRHFAQYGFQWWITNLDVIDKKLYAVRSTGNPEAMLGGRKITTAYYWADCSVDVVE